MNKEIEIYIECRWPNCRPFWRYDDYGAFGCLSGPKVGAVIFSDEIVSNRDDRCKSIEEYCAKTTFARDMDAVINWLKTTKPDFTRADDKNYYPFSALYYNLKPHKWWKIYEHPLLPTIDRLNSQNIEEYFRRHAGRYVLRKLAMPIRDEIYKYF